MTQIYIVRHAESEGNVRHILQGQADYPLSEKGKQQARMRAQNLAHVSFAAVFSSDLLRAHHTAEILATEHALVVVTKKTLRERNFGAFNGSAAGQFNEALKDLLAYRETLSHEERFSHKLAPDIESDAELMLRCTTFLREIAVAYPNEAVLVVTHSTVIKTLLIHLGRFTYEQSPDIYIKNTGYCVVECDGVELNVTELHDIGC